MKRIEKYKLALTDGLTNDQVVETTGPVDSILSVQGHKDEIFAWVLVGVGTKPSRVRFRLIQSMKLVPDDLVTWWEHVSTLQLRDGAVIVHVFVERASSSPLKTKKK